MKRILLSVLILAPIFAQGALLNMIALKEQSILTKEDIQNQIKEDWGINLDTSEISMSENAIVFKAENEMVALMNLDLPIPWDQIEAPCNYSSTWHEATTEMKEHNAHQIVSIISENTSLIKRELLLNKIVSSFLKLNKSIGVYIGRSQLVRSKQEFIEECVKIKDNHYPVANWIFYGLKSTNEGNTGFTIGMKHFGYKEFEILNSVNELSEIYALFYNTSAYVVQNDIIFKKKETIGYTESQKLPLKITKSSITEDKKVILIDF